MPALGDDDLAGQALRGPRRERIDVGSGSGGRQAPATVGDMSVRSAVPDA